MNKAAQEGFDDWFDYLLSSKRIVMCTDTFKNLLQETYEAAWERSAEETVESCLEHLPLPD